MLQISSYFSKSLFTIVREITHHSKGTKRLQSDEELLQVDPQLTGLAHTEDVALEFIKHICAVLAMDQNVQHDVLVSMSKISVNIRASK